MTTTLPAAAAAVMMILLATERATGAQQPAPAAGPFELRPEPPASSVRDARDLLLIDVRDGRLQLPELAAPPSSPDDDPPAERGTLPPARRAKAGVLASDPEAAGYVHEACAYYSVDPELVFCLIHQESGGRQYAVSHKGASGYMQLMPATARRFGVTDIFSKRQNIWAGVRYLKLLLNMFGDSVPLALAGYNAGEHRVIREGYRVPRIAETINYVRAISARYGRLTHRYSVRGATSRKAGASEPVQPEVSDVR